MKTENDIPRFQSIALLARFCIDQHPSQTKDQVVLMLDLVQADADLRDLLVSQPELEKICREKIYSVMLKDRQVIWSQHFNRPNPDPNRADRGLRRAAIRTLYEYPMFDGTYLGDSDRKKNLAQAEIHANQEQANGAKRLWHELIAKALVGNKTVRQCLDITELEKLQEEVRNA